MIVKKASLSKDLNIKSNMMWQVFRSC